MSTPLPWRTFTVQSVSQWGIKELLMAATFQLTFEWMKSSFQFRFFKWVIWTEEKGHQNLQRLKWNVKVAFMIGRPRGQLHCHRIMRCSDWEKVKRQSFNLFISLRKKKKSRPGKFKWLGLTHSTNWYQDVACGFLGLCPSANHLICVTKSRYGVTLY